ncbi:MAG TPA: hypothetical protein VFE69_06760, partial [Ilumatobacteraceae bacterium]|nr:hypothetical protein [Ilumatobacteraceae bacterium]
MEVSAPGGVRLEMYATDVAEADAPGDSGGLRSSRGCTASVAMIKEAVRRVRALPILVQDGVLAFVLMALSILSQVDHRPNDPKTDVWSYLLAVVGMGALTWRRTNPV